MLSLERLKHMKKWPLTYGMWMRSAMSVSVMFRRMLNYPREVVVKVYSCFLLKLEKIKRIFLSASRPLQSKVNAINIYGDLVLKGIQGTCFSLAL